MKKILFTFLFLMAFLAGYTQMYNSGGTITVETGATLVIEGSYTSTSGGTIEIDGDVHLKGDLINNSGSIGTGSIGLLTLNGSSTQNLTGSVSTTFYCAVEVDNTNGVNLGIDQIMDSVLILTAGDVTLGANDLTLSNEGATLADATKHIVTNGAGELKALVGNADYTFPVGDGTSFNPLVLNEAGTAETYGVIYTGALPGSWAGGTNHTVAANWAVSEASVGGANLTVKPQWNTGQEQTGFDRTDCAVGVTADNGLTVGWKASGAAVANGGAWTRTGSGFSSVGKFVLGDFWFEGIDLDLDVYLGGPYASGVMTKSLNTKNLIPLTDPYGLNTHAPSIPTDAVDWIKVELRDKADSTVVVKSYACFVDVNGNILDTNGNIGLKAFNVGKDLYYVSIQHRNHLGAMSSAKVDLTAASPAFNFTSAQTQAYQKTGISNTALKSLGGGKFGLWAGNANANSSVVYDGGSSDRITILLGVGLTTPGVPITNTYHNRDVNMDGDIVYDGGGSDRVAILTKTVGLTTPGVPVNQHLP